MRNPWIAMGDFNNVLTSKNMIGGNNVNGVEYRDLAGMMQNVGLFEASTKGFHFTWSNKHTSWLIYSRIGMVIKNVKWYPNYQDATIEILAPNISDHAPLKISLNLQKSKKKSLLIFFNYITHDPSFMQIISSSWRKKV